MLAELDEELALRLEPALPVEDPTLTELWAEPSLLVEELEAALCEAPFGAATQRSITRPSSV